MADITISGVACPTCFKTFKTIGDQQKHSAVVHNKNRNIPASERPINRGAIPCGIGECQHTFSNENAAIQHRRDKHQISENAIVGRPDTGQNGKS